VVTWLHFVERGTAFEIGYFGDQVGVDRFVWVVERYALALYK